MNAFVDKVVYDFLPRLGIAILVFIIGYVVIRLVLRLLNKPGKSDRISPTVRSFFNALLKVVLLVFLIITCLSIIGVPMASMITALGATGVAISLAVKDSLANLCGGFLIILTKPFKVGDYVECDGVAGTVAEINTIHTRLLTPDNKTIYIPNGQVTTAQIVNFTEQENRRLDLEFGISYENDFEKAKRIIREIVEKHPLTVKDPAPVVRLGRHDASALVIVVRVWVAKDSYWDLNYDLVEQVKVAFDENEISIPFNQLDVHVVSHKENG